MYKSKRILSFILAIALLVGGIPVTAFADISSNLNLSFSDVNNNQDVFSKSYMVNGEKKTLYAYNTKEGTCKVTGDIPYASGTYKSYSIRHEEGYLEFPFSLQDISVGCITDESAEGCYLLFLTKDNELRSFTYLTDSWWERVYDSMNSSYQDYPSGEPIQQSGYDAPRIKDNIVKLQGNVFLSEDGLLYVHSCGVTTKIGADVADFYMISNNVLKTILKNGQVEYHSIEGVFEYSLNKPILPWESYSLDGEYIYKDCTDTSLDTESNFLVYKYTEDNTLCITPSHNLFTIENLITNLDGTSQYLTWDLADSVANNKYTYNLFDGNVTLILGQTESDDKDYVSSLEVFTSNGTKAELGNTGIKTEFGDILFQVQESGYSFRCITLIDSENDNASTSSFEQSLADIIEEKYWESRGGCYSIYNLYVNGVSFLDYDWIIKGHTFKSSFTFGDKIIDVYINYNLEEATITDRASGTSYNISSSVFYSDEYSGLFSDIVNYFVLDYGYENIVYPSFRYIKDDDYIQVYYSPAYDEEDDIYAKLRFEYSRGRTSYQEFLDKNTPKEIIDFNIYDLYYFLACSNGAWGVTSKDLTLIDYVANDFFELNVDTSDWNVFKNGVALVETAGLELTMFYLYLTYYYGDNMDAIKESYVYSLVKSHFSETGEYTNTGFGAQLDPKYRDYAHYVQDVVAKKLTAYYLLNTNTPISVDDFVTKSIPYYAGISSYKVSAGSYTGKKDTAVSVLVYEQEDLLSTISPYLYSNKSTNLSNIADEYFYAIDENLDLQLITADSTSGHISFEGLEDLEYEACQPTSFYQEKLASNVVKVNALGYYLTKDGSLYTDKGILFKSGITNLSDNLYEYNGKWYYLDSSKEFLFDYASDLNVRPLVLNATDDMIIYEFSYNNDIAYITAPNGDKLESGDTYVVNNNGAYVFEVINKYGDTFEELLLVKHLGIAGTSGITPTVVDNKLTIQAPEGSVFEYSLDNVTWETFTGTFDMTENKHIYIRGTAGETSLGTYLLNLLANNELEVYNLTPAEFNPDNFYGVGYLKDGALYDSDNQQIQAEVTDAIFWDNDTYLYIDDFGDLYTGYYSDTVIPIYRSAKIDFESDLNQVVDIAGDGIYAYLLGDSGNLVSLALNGDKYATEIDMYTTAYWYSWSQDWLSDDVESIKHGVAYKQDGSSIQLYDESSLDTSSLLYQKGYTDDDEPIYVNNIVVRAVEYIKDTNTYYILTSNLDVYKYNVGTNSGVAEYDYTIDLEANTIDYVIENTAWVNESGYTVDFTLPDDLPDLIVNSNFYRDSSFSATASAKQKITELLSLSPTWEVSKLNFDDYFTYYIKTGDEAIKISTLNYGGRYSATDSPFYCYETDTYTEVYADVTYINSTGTVTTYSAGNSSHTNNLTGYWINTVTLEPNTCYMIRSDASHYLSDSLSNNIFIVNGEFTSLNEYADTQHYTTVMNSFSEYDIEHKVDKTYSFTPEEVGIYSIQIRNSDDKVVTRAFIKVGNIDTYKPELKSLKVNADGTITPVFKDYNDATGRTATSGVWTLEYSADGGNSWIPFEGSLVYSPVSTYNLRNRSTVITQPNILLRATDKAGNVSDAYPVSLDMTIFDSYIYENGKTTVKFYADDDTNWDDSAYSYSYEIDSTTLSGHEFSVFENTEVLLKALKDDAIDMSTMKPVEVEVVVVNKPLITLTDDLAKISATGKYVNADFTKLFVNIDRTGYQEYTVEELEKTLGVGTYIIDAYYEVEKDGQTVTSEVETAVFTVADLADTEIHTEVEYENGKTILEFYANNDTDNSEFTYSYMIAGTEYTGHTVEVTEDTIVDLKAEKSGHKDANKVVNISVISTEVPNISTLVDNKYVTVSKGDIVNATLEKLTITLDGVVSETTSASEILELLTEGSHNIKATQTVKAIIDGETITVTSDEAEATVTVNGGIELHPTIKYENGKTEVTFYADEDVNHNSGYEYSYKIDGVGSEGHALEITEESEVIIKAEKTGKTPAEDELNLTVISVGMPNITKVSDSVAVVTVGGIKNTNFDKLHIQYNNGNIVEFNTTMVEVPLVVGENIIKAYVTTKTTIDGNIVEITSDTNEKTFNIADNSKTYYTVTVRDHFGSDINTRLQTTVEAGSTYSYSALSIGGWNVVGDTTKTGTVNTNITLDFYYEQEQVPVGTYYNLIVRDHFGSEVVTRSTQSLKEGTEYKVTALGLNDWNVTGTSNYTGVLNGNLTIDFYYEANTPSFDDNSNYVSIKVIDHLGATSVTREDISVLKGTEYSYLPISYNGYKATTNTGVSGTATDNVVIDFNYTSDANADTDLLNLKVVDHFGTTAEIRYNNNVESGFYYNVGSIDRAGWLLTSNSNYSGIVLNDTELHFYYNRVPANAVTYTLTVKDHFGTDVNTRFVETLIAGDSYNVNALTVGKWLVQGVANYSGNISSDLVIDFYYEQEQEPVIEYYTLTVKDTFGANTSVRYVQTLTENSSYIVNALNVGGWTVNGVSNYSGTITEDTVVEFHYVEDSAPVVNYYTLTVKDTFGTDTNIRYTQTLSENSSYVVNALNIGGWVLNGTASYSGVITGDLVIEFTYSEEQEPVIEYYTITVKDIFGDDTNIRYVQSLSKDSNYSVSALVLDNWAVRGSSIYSGTITQDLVLEFVYDSTVVTPTYYTLTVKDTFDGVTSTRFTQKLEANSNYSVNALSIEGWKASGVSSRSGSITQDLVIEFTYIKETQPEPTYYTLTVKDIIGDVTNTRFVQSLVEGSNYSVNAMVIDGYTLVGVSTYSGTINQDTVIEFIYEKDASPVKNYFNLTVKDVFDDKSTVRYVQPLEEGSTYVVNALDIEGWEVISAASYSDIITSDLVVEFVYKSTIIEPTYYTLIVKDTFGDKTTVRYTQQLLAGSEYHVSALNLDGWSVDGTSLYEGTISKDLVVNFNYIKNAVDEKPVHYDLTIIDKFGSNEVTRGTISLLADTAYIVTALGLDKWNVVGVDSVEGILNKNTTVVFTYEADEPSYTDDYSDYATIKVYDNDTLRVSRKVLKGTSYSYEALKLDGFRVTSEGKYSGVANKDIIIKFTYVEDDTITYDEEYYTLTVYDEFDTKECRFSIQVEKGYYYNVGALDRAGWVAEISNSFVGTVVENTILVFRYTKINPPIDDDDDDPVPPTPDDDDPVPPPKEDDEPEIPGPQTGDDTNLALLFWLMLASGISIVLCSIKRRR